MALEIRIEANGGSDDSYNGYKAYTIHADNHRILSLVNTSKGTVDKWLSEAAKSVNNKSPTSLLVVGVCVERETLSGLREQPYDLISLCIGSHCLICEVDDDGNTNTWLKPLRQFFQNPRVVAVGMDMKSVAQNLERDHRIKVMNPRDLQEMATNVSNVEDQQNDLYSLAQTVLGKVVLHPEELQWWDGQRLSVHRVKYSTVDAYLAYRMGSKLLDGDADDLQRLVSSSKKKKMH